MIILTSVVETYPFWIHFENLFYENDLFTCSPSSSFYFRHFGALGNVQMTAKTVNVNVTDDVISLDPESDAFIGGRAFNLHALPDDFQVNKLRLEFFIAGQSSERNFLSSFFLCWYMFDIWARVPINLIMILGVKEQHSNMSKASLSENFFRLWECLDWTQIRQMTLLSKQFEIIAKKVSNFKIGE